MLLLDCHYDCYTGRGILALCALFMMNIRVFRLDCSAKVKRVSRLRRINHGKIPVITNWIKGFGIFHIYLSDSFGSVKKSVGEYELS